MPTLTARTVLASLSLVSAAAFAQPADPLRGQSLWARTNDAPLSCGQDGSCHGPDPSLNQYRALRGADNAALILNAIGAVRTGMAFLAPHVSERDAVDIAAFLGEVSRRRAAGTPPAADVGVTSGTGVDGGAGGGDAAAGAPAADAGLQAAIVPPFNAGYGGCSLGLPGAGDPTLPALFAAASLALALRARRRRRPVARSAAAGATALLITALLALPVTARAVTPGEAAPAFVLPALDGGAVSLESVRGHVVWLDFWASWCAPCRQSFPWMADLQRRHGARGLRVLAVNVDARSEDARRFVARDPPPFAIALDPSGDLARRYAIRAMPTSVLIDASGRVLAVHNGFRTADAAELERRIERALDASAGIEDGATRR
ncbi:MAG: TlpA disulfide reductase family protein [Burkholderiales bacterium]|nr:TlpA disulfide reductase family protein [Burkholderiales bacterium]